jgi:hypothetical protein
MDPPSGKGKSTGLAPLRQMYRVLLEAARLELDKLKGTVVPTAKAVFGHLVVHFRL